MARRIRKAVFPVGGLGTRFLPQTKVIPKEMLPVVDKPLIQYAYEEARAAGIDHFIFVASRGKEALADHFDSHFELAETLLRRGKLKELEELRSWEPSLGQISYVRQPEALGLGHAVLAARHVVGDEPFAVLLPDDIVLSDTPCLAQMVTAREKIGDGNMVAVMDVPREHTQRYGVLTPGEVDGRLTEVLGLVEKPKPEEAPSTLSVIGRYILEPEIFDYLALQERGAGNEIQLTDSLAAVIGKAPFHGYSFEGQRFDCGDKVGFLEANVAFALRRPDIASKLKPFLRDLVGHF